MRQDEIYRFVSRAIFFQETDCLVKAALLSTNIISVFSNIRLGIEFGSIPKSAIGLLQYQICRLGADENAT
jgi:hypothetical protein